MSQPERAALLRQMNSLHIPYGQLAIWALGQSGFAIKGGDTIIYIDPYLSDSIAGIGGPARRFPTPIAPEEATNAAAVFATHEHMDHADQATLGPLMAASAKAVLITTQGGAQEAQEADVTADRIRTPKINTTEELGEIRYTTIPAAHYAYEETDGYARWMGFLIEWNGVSLYHAGDTIIVPELLDALKGKRIDVGILPLNGRDFFRETEENLTGNMLPHEGVLLAQRLEIGVIISSHNDLFASNRLPSGMLFDAIDQHAPFQRCHMLQPGELYIAVAQP